MRYWLLVAGRLGMMVFAVWLDVEWQRRQGMLYFFKNLCNNLRFSWWRWRMTMGLFRRMFFLVYFLCKVLNRLREVMNLKLHLHILISFHLINDTLLLKLEKFNFFLVIPHHLFLLMLNLLYVFLKISELLLKLLFQWLKF